MQGTPGYNPEAFIEVHRSSKRLTSVRFNPLKTDMQPVQHGGDYPFGDTTATLEAVPWSRTGFYLSPRPSFTFDPLLHAGGYYVQEASSMFLEQAITQLAPTDRPLRVLDLSAAPGGKSTHLISLLPQDSLLVSNEVIRGRANILADNLTRWGRPEFLVTNNDPRDLSRLPGFFDIIVADAPCSGSGLFRKDPEAITEWSLNNVTLCAQRQQRILADAWPALKPGGLLIYSTCSYSTAENEDIKNWLVREMNAEVRQILLNADWGITESQGGYRFWPDKAAGEGFFMACVQKPAGGETSNLRPGRLNAAARTGAALAARFLENRDWRFVQHENDLYAWPSAVANDMAIILERLRVIHSGIRVGELMRDKIVPNHSLAMSIHLDRALPGIDLDLPQAIAYLQRKDVSINTNGKGWQLVKYMDRPLGWVNVLPNRINNYYPKELRILKDK